MIFIFLYVAGMWIHLKDDSLTVVYVERFYYRGYLPTRPLLYAKLSTIKITVALATILVYPCDRTLGNFFFTVGNCSAIKVGKFAYPVS